jgi:hypothetical protein
MGKTNLWHDDIRKPNNIGLEKAGACVIQECVAIVSPDSTQTSLTTYTQKATVAWLAVA